MSQQQRPDNVSIDDIPVDIDNTQSEEINPDTNVFLHLKLGTTQNLGLSAIFFGELREKHDVEDAVFLVDGAPWLQEALRRYGLRFQYVTHGNRNAIERLYKEIKRRTNQFANHFRHAVQQPPKHGCSPKPSAKIS